jgi:hypothetical protein
MSVTHPKAPNHSFRRLANQLPPLEIDEPLPIHDRITSLHRMSVGTPSKPILGLPIARLVPMDCHSFMDYGAGLAIASTAMMTDDRAAQLGSAILASSVIGVSAVTDYRISVLKLIPIEAHEVIDYAWSLAAIAAPFALGYWKSSPKIAITHIAAGVMNILGSLVTDYRAYSRRTSKRTAR